jgi:hypothetical protein
LKETTQQIPASVQTLADEHFGGNVIVASTRQQLIDDGVLVDMTEWASRREVMGGFLTPEVNMCFWGSLDAPVAFSRRLWEAVDIEKDCPGEHCDKGKTTLHPEGGNCPVCNGKGKVKGRGVWQDTRGRAHDVIWMGHLAASSLVRRNPNLDRYQGYYKLHLSKDGTTSGRLVMLKIVIDGDGVWIGYPDEN